jgi:hypothetical protein
LYVFIVSPTSATQYAHLMHLDLNFLMVFGEAAPWLKRLTVTKNGRCLTRDEGKYRHAQTSR